MSTRHVTDLSRYPTSISGDQIVQNLIQVGQSDGIDAVSLDHDFYGISKQGQVFSMAAFRVVESGPNTNKGTLELHLYNSMGISVPVLTIGEDGVTVSGSFNVKGEHTSLETTSVVVEDKDMVLASGATSLAHLDKGGIILGTDESGTKSMLYDLVGDSWTSNVGINIDTAAAFTVGDTQTILDATGLTMGEVSLTAGSLKLATDVSLEIDGLEIGDVSLTPLGGLIIGDPEGSDAVNSVVVDKSGLTIGEDISLGIDTGLSLGSDVLLDQQGLHLKDADAAIYLGETGWKIGFDSSSQHLQFEFYDANSNSYVTKAEIKS